MSQDFEIEVLSGGKTLIKYHGNEKEVVIPDGIEIIGGDAFTRNENVINIQIPPTVRQIESGRDGAFWGCRNLLNVILPVELEEIGSNAFSYCTSLTSMKIPDSVTNIGHAAFSNCSNLLSINIPKGVTQVLSDVFMGCTSLTKIQIPGNVETIGWSTFKGCTGLISVEIENGVREIGREAFSGCSNLTTIILPEGLQKIDDDAFSSCNRLGSLILPKSIKKVSPSAFTHCNPQIELCFYYHHDHLESNQLEGFQCRYVTLVNEDGRKIGKLFLLSSERWDEHQLFLRRLVSGYVDHLSEYDALFSTASDLIIRLCKVAICRLENPLELMDEYRKMYVTYLQNNGKYILPHLIRTGDIASISCLARINAIPRDGINSYVEEASKLSLLEITAILLDYKNRRRGKDEIPAITLDNEAPLVEWDTQVNVDDTLTITRYKGTATDVTIPAMINGIAVKRISGLLGSLRISVFFPHMECVRSVVIEAGIEVVGERAFLDCQNLGLIHLPESILEIGEEAFYNCENLESIVFPKHVTKMGPRAFSYCTKLACIEIPRKVERIESHTFSYCTNLAEVKIPNDVIGIGESAFRRCTSLEIVILPENLQEIGSGAFAGCEKLMSIALPFSITRIRDWVFKDCTSLESVFIPSETNKIDWGTFENCPNLTIHSPKGSYAIEYAKKNGIKYEEI